MKKLPSRSLRVSLPASLVFTLVLAWSFCFAPAVKAQSDPFKVDGESYRLLVQGLVNRPLTLSLKQIRDLPQAPNDIWASQGPNGYQGILLKQLISRAQPHQDADQVVFICLDGFYSILPLDYVMEGRVLLAHSQAGMPLTLDEGFPLKVVPDELVGYKWVETGWLKRIMLIKSNP